MKNRSNAIKRYYLASDHRARPLPFRGDNYKKKSVGRWGDRLFDSSPGSVVPARGVPGEEYRVRERVLVRRGKGSIGSIGRGPSASRARRSLLPALLVQCFSRHTDKGTQIPRENPLRRARVCHNEAHITLTRISTREHVCGKAAAFHGTQLFRREISYEITGSHLPGPTSSLLLGLRGVDH